MVQRLEVRVTDDLSGAVIRAGKVETVTFSPGPMRDRGPQPPGRSPDAIRWPHSSSNGMASVWSSSASSW